MSGIHVNLGLGARRDNPNAKGLIKHMILNSLLSYRQKYGKEYGELVLALDSRNYWRKDKFPFYKGNRKKDREKSGHDWEFIFEVINETKAELRENFPYKMIEIPAAEADDVIACITKYLQKNELTQQGLMTEPQPILIISSDGDFVQLQKYRNVRQWAPQQKKFVKPSGTIPHFIIEHICTAGDDGIPNICSPDNSFVDGIRQKSFRKDRLPEFFAKGIDACKDDTERRNYQRNQMMIDFDFIPETIYNNIIAEYTSQKPVGNKMKIMNYFIKNKMKLLIEHAGSF
jgi:hypothetical protein